jgi:23S rRNA U2552 (ribose-2'-O)-methylase RlmE/FtsJ
MRRLPKDEFPLLDRCPEAVGGDDPDDDGRSPAWYAAENRVLHARLNACKDRISDVSCSRWNACKKLCNEYELIRKVSSYQPVSRAFYKLHEILHDYEREIDLPKDRAVRAAFLAEGPGGFVESFARYRSSRGSRCTDELHCITLVSTSSKVPGWKLGAIRAIAPGATMQVHRGADGTGNLYNPSNIDHFVEPLSESCALVTADGGFDCSGDFNSQETDMALLLLCEVYTALRVQSPGGAFVLKVFDIQSEDTIRILGALSSNYASVSVVKPLSSRPANSEKYVVCCGFSPSSSTAELIAALGRAVRSTPQRGGALTPWLPEASPHCYRAILGMNRVYVERQMAAITATLKAAASSTPSAATKTSSNKKHVELAKTWCHTYELE